MAMVKKSKQGRATKTRAMVQHERVSCLERETQAHCVIIEDINAQLQEFRLCLIVTLLCVIGLAIYSEQKRA